MSKDIDNRNRKVRIYDPIRAAAIKWVSEKHNCSKEYVRAIINGTANAGRSDEILASFREKYRELEKVLK